VWAREGQIIDYNNNYCHYYYHILASLFTPTLAPHSYEKLELNELINQKVGVVLIRKIAPTNIHIDHEHYYDQDIQHQSHHCMV